jgi:hypothetical protein
MKPGAGPVVVLVGVLLGAGALAWVLYEAGKSPVEPTLPPVADPVDPKAPARRVPTPPPPVVEPEADPNRTRPGPVPSDALPRWPVEGHPDLKLRNWKDVAEAYMDMLVQHREVAEKGMPPPSPDDAARTQLMQTRAKRMMERLFNRPFDLPEGDKVTAIDHPAFAVNLAAAVLDRAKMPLTEAQARRLQELGVERGPFVDKADAAIDDANDTTYLLARFAARAHVIEGFYSELYSTLTPAQGEALSPEALRNRIQLDLASPAASWMRVCRPMHFSDQNQLVELITNGLANQFKLLDRQDELRKIVEAWAKSDTFDAADLLDRKGFLKASHVAAAVPRMIDLLRRIVDGMQLDEEMANSAKVVPIAFVPLRL